MALLLYFVFTLVAVVGYATFGLNPEWLVGRPALAAFYGQAFTLFGQGHVIIGAGVLGIYLVRHAGGGWLLAFGAVYLVSFLSEFVGTGHGLPFGHYYYTDLLGPKWFDRVPLLIPLSWFLMALPAYVIVRRGLAGRGEVAGRITLATVLFVVWDLSLDPAMSYLTSYWVWEDVGPYYGMPLLNLFGWLGTALVLMILIEALSGSWIERLSARWMVAFYGITLLMPLGMVVAGGLWLSALLTAAGLGLCYLILLSVGPGEPNTAHSRTTARETAEEVEPPHFLMELSEARVIFATHARSFSFASRAFPPTERRLIACLYTFCRTTDDLVDCADGRSTEEVEKRMAVWRQLAHRSYRGLPSGLTWLDEIMAASARAGAPSRLIDELIEGVLMDLGPVDLQTLDELEAYAYRVASVVGIWMCYLAGVHDTETLRRAAAMGRAMQLTNILRDVGEDLESERIYLPAELRHDYGITVADLRRMQRTGVIKPAYRRLIDTLMARADAEYAYAFPALARLPASYARASAVAAEVYRGIHQEIRRNGYDNLRRRAYTGTIRKARLALRGLWRLWKSRRKDVAAVHRKTDNSWSEVWEGPGKTVQLWAIGGVIAFFSLAGFPTETLACDDSWTKRVETMELDTLRMHYVEAVEDQGVLEETLGALEDRPEESLYEEAYAAALTVLRARHAFWPHTRLRHLRAGLGVLDYLVEACPGEVEVRYLRLLSGYFLPGILGRGSYVEEDFAALARLLPDAYADFPTELYKDMVRFVIEHGEPSEKEKVRLEQAKRTAELAGEGDA